MAAAAAWACKRVGQLGSNSGVSLIGLGGFGASRVPSSVDRAIYDPFSAPLPSISGRRQISCRHISQMVNSNGNRLFLVDTLALVIY